MNKSNPMPKLDFNGFARLALVAALAALLVGLPVPIPVRALLEVGIMGAATLVTLVGALRSTDMRVARIAFLAMLALYVGLLLNSNIPDLSSGLQGIRYTMVAISGLMLGLALPDRPGDQLGLIKVIAVLLLTSAIASLVVHLLAPGYESSLSRSADEATSVLGGQKRMQGLLSGPFHISILGSFLALAGAWILHLRRPVGGVFLAVGIALLLLSRVRTGLLTTGIGLLILLAIGFQQNPTSRFSLRSLWPRGKRTWAILALVVAALIGVVAFASDNSAVKGVVDLPNDQRVESRLDMLNEAVDLAWESPITGWGPGSSATATRLDFVEAGKVHVKPHNGALGIIIESGIIGLTLFCLLCGSTLLNLWRSSRLEKQKRMTGVAAAAVIPLVGFWSFGDALAALPITLCLGLIVGIYLANGFADERPQGANID
jgi:hypothetical protein